MKSLLESINENLKTQKISERLHINSKTVLDAEVDEEYLLSLLKKFEGQYDLELFDYLEDKLGFKFDWEDGMNPDEDFKCWSQKYNIGIVGQITNSHKVFKDTFLEIFTDKKEYKNYRMN